MKYFRFLCPPVVAAQDRKGLGEHSIAVEVLGSGKSIFIH